MEVTDSAMMICPLVIVSSVQLRVLPSAQFKSLHIVGSDGGRKTNSPKIRVKSAYVTFMMRKMDHIFLSHYDSDFV